MTERVIVTGDSGELWSWLVEVVEGEVGWRVQ